MISSAMMDHMGNPAGFSKKLAASQQVGIPCNQLFEDRNGRPAMRNTFILSLSVLALAACGSEPAAEKSAEDVIAEASKMASPLPGLYENRSELKEFSMPGIPAAQVDMMKQQFSANANKTNTFCLTQAQADTGFEDMVRQMGDMGGTMQCKFSQFDASGAKLDAQLNCSGEGGMTMNIGMDGTVEPERSDVTMTMKGGSSMAPGMEMTMIVRGQTTRVGDCPA
jgi:hypothetical protein